MMEGGSSRRGGGAEEGEADPGPHERSGGQEGQLCGKEGVHLERNSVGSDGGLRMNGTLATRLSSEPKQKSRAERDEQPALLLMELSCPGVGGSSGLPTQAPQNQWRTSLGCPGSIQGLPHRAPHRVEGRAAVPSAVGRGQAAPACTCTALPLLGWGTPS